MTFETGGVLSQYKFDISELRKNALAAKRHLRELAQQAKETGEEVRRQQAGIGGAGGATGADAAANAARKAALAQRALEQEQRKLAQSEIRLAVATKDYARALDIVDRELGQVRADTVQYNNLLTQQAAITARATREAQQHAQALAAQQRQASQTGMERLGKAAAGAFLLKEGFDLAKEGAQIKAVAASFDQLSQASGQTADVLLGKLRGATRGTVNDFALMAASNRALLSGNEELIASLPRLAAMAKTLGQAVGLDTAQAYERLVSGIQKKEIEVIDELGINVKLTSSYEAYAKSIGKSVAELTEQEQTQALLNAVLEQGETKMRALKGATDDTADTLMRLEATGINAFNFLKQAAADWVASISQQFQQARDLIGGFLDETFVQSKLTASPVSLLAFHQEVLKGAENYEEYRRRIQEANDQLPFYASSIEQITPMQYAFAQQLMETGRSATEAIIVVRAMGDVTQGEFTEALNTATAAQTLLAAVVEGVMVPAITEQAIPAVHVYNEALAENLQKGLDAEVQTRNLTGAQDLLASLGNAVAAGLMTASEAALILASRYNIATDAAAGLINMSARLAGAPGAIAEQYIPAGADRTLSKAERARADRATEEKKAAGKAEREYRDAVASSAQKQALLRAELAKTVEGSERYWEIKKELAQLEKADAKAGAKANNAAARDAERAQKQAEDQARRLIELERDAARDREEIQRNHLRKMQELSRDYHIDETRSEEDFQKKYRRLLAEGKRAEAELLKEEFETEKRRRAEDFQRDRSDQVDDTGQRLTDRERDLADRLAKEAGKDRPLTAEELARARQIAEQGAQAPGTAGGVAGSAGGGAAAAGGAGGRSEITIILRPELVDGDLIFRAVEPQVRTVVDSEIGELAVIIDTATISNPPGGGQPGIRSAG